MWGGVVDIKLLKSSILSNTIPKFLIFFVDEPALYRQYIHSISSTISRDYEIYSTAREAIYDIESNIKDDHIYVVFDDLKIVDEEIEKLKISNKNVIICFNSLLSDLPQGVASILKKYDKYFVTFNKIDKDTLLAYALKLCKNNKCSVDSGVLAKLIECCDYDLGIMINELNKIFLLEQSNSNLLVNYMIDEGFIDYRDVSLSRFVDCVVSKNKNSFLMYQKIEDSPITIITNIYNVSLNMLKQTRAVAYSRLMKICFELQKGIVDGTVDSKYAIKYLLLRWFS